MSPAKKLLHALMAAVVRPVRAATKAKASRQTQRTSQEWSTSTTTSEHGTRENKVVLHLENVELLVGNEASVLDLGAAASKRSSTTIRLSSSTVTSSCTSEEEDDDRSTVDTVIVTSTAGDENDAVAPDEAEDARAAFLAKHPRTVICVMALPVAEQEAKACDNMDATCQLLRRHVDVDELDECSRMRCVRRFWAQRCGCIALRPCSNTRCSCSLAFAARR